jgi:hypothetical protein
MLMAPRRDGDRSRSLMFIRVRGSRDRVVELSLNFFEANLIARFLLSNSVVEHPLGEGVPRCDLAP